MRTGLGRPAGISRRGALGLTLAAGAAIALPAARPARAHATPFRFKAGEAEITVLSDGGLELPSSFVLPGRELAEIDAAYRAAGQSFSGFRSEVNVALVRTGPSLVLVDTGAGPDFMPSLGKFAEHLETAGVKPGDITHVVFTHAHADHLWGVIDPLGGDTLFEKALHLMTAPERDFWLADGIEHRVPAPMQGMAAGTQRRLRSIAPRIETLRPGTEIVPGLTAIDTSGHTPGHISILVGTGTDGVLISGDALTQDVISFARPAWRWGADLDGDKAAATRRRLLDQLATDRLRLLGYHLPWPGLGHVERKEGAFRFAPA